MNTLFRTVLAACTAIGAHAADINLKFTGISIDPQGTAGVDYVAEHVWYDTLSDDDVVLYLKSDVSIAMSHNEDNLLAKGYDVDGQYPGDIWYKIDGDRLTLGNFYQSKYSHVMDDPAIRDVILFKYDDAGAFSLASFKGRADTDNGVDEDDSEYFRYGYTDAYGDEWHTVTFWDNDSATADYVDDLYASNGDLRDACSSDGKIIQVVLDPQTPAITVTATGNDEYYTTPPKFYYTGKIYRQTTYLTSGCTIGLYNLQNAETVQYRVDGGGWQDYSGPLTASSLFSTDDTVYDFEFRNGTAGTAKLRKMHYNPAQPAQDEEHPKLRFSSEADLEVMKGKVTGGDAALTDWFDDYDQDYYLHLGADYRCGMRNLDGTFPYSSYYYMQRGVGDAAYANAFVGRMKDYDETYLKRAKEALLYLYTADPIGGETFAGRGGGPSQERVMYSDGKCTFSPQMAYDLIFDYTTDNGYTYGMTAVQHIKIRDNLASEAANLIRFPNSTGGGFWLTSDFSNASTRNTQIEQAWTCIALALPTYDTEYYGTSGADGTAPTHTYAPLEELPIAWIDVSDKVLINHPTDPSLFRKSALACIISEDGLYIGQPREGYISMMMRRANDFVIARANFDGHHYERLERYFEHAILCRYPFSGDLMPNTLFEGGYGERWDMGYLVRSDFPDAGLYQWSKFNPDTADWSDDLWSDPAVAPAVPAHDSKVTDGWAVLSSGQGDPDAVMMRTCGVPDSMQQGGGTFLNYRPYYNICAYGERLGIEKAGYHRYDNGGDYNYMTMQRRKNTVMIDHENDLPYQTFNAAMGSEVLTGDLDAFSLDSYNDYASSGCAFQANDVTLHRQVLFPDKKFFIIGDWLNSGTGSHEYTWLYHGSMYNATTAGTFSADDATDAAVWTKPSGVEMHLRFVTDVTLRDSIEYDYIDNNTSEGNPEPFVLADRTGTDVPFLALLFPVDAGGTDPVITELDVVGAEAATVVNGADSSTVCVAMQADPGNPQSVTAARMTTDAVLGLYREDASGALTYAYMGNGTAFGYNGADYVSADAALTAKIEPGDSTVTLTLAKVYRGAESVALTVGGLTAGGTYVRLVDWTAVDTLTADGSGTVTFTQDVDGHTVVLSGAQVVGINDVKPGVAGIAGLPVPLKAGTPFTFTGTGGVIVRITDMRGGEVVRLSGTDRIAWDGGIEAGVYLVSISDDNGTQEVRRMVVVP